MKRTIWPNSIKLNTLLKQRRKKRKRGRREIPKRKRINGAWARGELAKETDDKYGELYNNYIGMSGKYIEENRKAPEGNSAKVVDLFFEDYVKGEFNKIESYIF